MSANYNPCKSKGKLIVIHVLAGSRPGYFKPITFRNARIW